MAMENVSKERAKAKLQLLTMVLFFGLIAGAVFEYQQATAPLDEVVVVYHSLKNEAQKESVAQPVLNESKPEVVHEIPQAQNNVEPVQKVSAVDDFLGYMFEMQDKINAIKQEETILDKMKQSEPKKKDENVAKPTFEEGKIEVFDTEKGVISVVEEAHDAEVKSDTLDNVSVEVETHENLPIEDASALVDENVRERVNGDIQEVQNNGEEAPVVLIPGMQ